MTLKKIIFGSFQTIVNISTLVALILQCIEVPNNFAAFVPVIAYTVIALVALNLLMMGIITFRDKSVVHKSSLVKRTKSLMHNATENVILFGGDLSWAVDYKNTIKELTENSKVVEVIFPFSKLANAKKSVWKQFTSRVDVLESAGAKIYYTDNDCLLRCTLIDVNIEGATDDLKILSSKRIYRDKDDETKNKYRLSFLEYKNEHDKMICNSFLRNYILLKNQWKEYNN